MKVSDGSVTTPSGFLAAGIACGLKESGQPDLGLVVSEGPATIAAVFTEILVKAAPVLRGMKCVLRGKARAFLANSGCANACTGDAGLKDADDTATAAAAALDVPAEEVFVASTGKIGLRLDVEAMNKAVPDLVGALSADGGDDFARAIMTTDTVPKTAAVEVELSTGKVAIGGCAKGSGMIAPRMATMLAFLTTDVGVGADVLDRALRDAVEVSFNRITVDGHMSTNDTVVIMANGRSGAAVASDEDIEKFTEALTALCRHLAKSIVRDGEGATKLVEVGVVGAPSDADAERIARKIAESPLVKCAFFGADPNWGRIVSAAGYAGVDFRPEDVTLDIGEFRVFESGVPAGFDRDAAVEYMKGKDISVLLSVGRKAGSAVLWTCDLSYKYVEINAEYTT